MPHDTAVGAVCHPNCDCGRFVEIWNNVFMEFNKTADGRFNGGLADQSWTSTRYHTATHLLHKALRDVLGTSVEQRGSNITADRMRCDFSHPQKMTPEEIRKVEALVNEAIERDLPVH